MKMRPQKNVAMSIGLLFNVSSFTGAVVIEEYGLCVQYRAPE